MVEVRVTAAMEGTPVAVMLKLLDRCGLALLVYRDLPLDEFVRDLLAAIPRLSESRQLDSDILEIRESSFNLYWAPLRTPGGTIALLTPFARDTSPGFVRTFMQFYLDPIQGLEGSGYSVGAGRLGEVDDPIMAARLQAAHI